MQRIIVTGISGFLGQHFADAPQSAWEIHGTYHQQAFREGDEHFHELDLNDIDYTRALFDSIDAGAIVHLAAMSSPAACQAQPAAAYQLNVVLPAFLAQYAYAKRIPFYFASTDLVFAGTAAPYDYTALPDPLNYYGQQKAEAERRIMDIHPVASILRLPLLYGYTPGRSNFLTTWVEQLRQQQAVAAFTDEYRSPLYVRDAVRAILQLVRQRKMGVWHLGGPERLSRYEMARQVAQAIDADANLVLPTKQSEILLQTPRPADVSLTDSKAGPATFHARPFADGLTATLKRYDQR